MPGKCIWNSLLPPPPLYQHPRYANAKKRQSTTMNSEMGYGLWAEKSKVNYDFTVRWDAEGSANMYIKMDNRVTCKWRILARENDSYAFFPMDSVCRSINLLHLIWRYALASHYESGSYIIISLTIAEIPRTSLVNQRCANQSVSWNRSQLIWRTC